MRSYGTLCGMSQLLHATAVALGDRAVLLTGPSGSGKSDLALRLIDRGAVLVGDDAVVLKEGLLSGPQRLQGQIEVRGVGIVHTRSASKPIALALHIDLVPRDAVVRMPEARLSPYGVPRLCLHAFDHSTPLKVEAALSQLVNARQAAQL